MTQFTAITVFGGTGFLGRHIIRRLAKTGAIIRIPSRTPEDARLLKSMGDVGQIVPFHCSTRDDTSVANAIATSDTVINLVGVLFEKGRNTFQSLHVETAARIARVAREKGCRNFVHMSALGALPGSLSSYARSKAAGEQAVRMFFPDAIIMRPSIVFGPEDNFFNMLSRLSKFSPILPLIGGGITKFQPVYVGDVADAVLRALDACESRGQIYELGGPKTYSFCELLEILMKETKRKRYLFDIPWGLAKLEAAILELMPKPLLTRDQVDLLRSDNIIRNQNAKTFRDMGIHPTSLEIILPTYLM